MITTVLGATLLVAAGWLPARAVTRSSAWGFILAPLVTGLACSAAAYGSLVTRSDFLPWVVATLVVVQLLGASFGPRISRLLPTLGRHPEAHLGVPVAHLIVVAVIVAIPFIAVRRPPVDWDGRSIWWMHARWMVEGGANHADALVNRAFNFAHQDYPPFASATAAALWRVFGGVDLKQSQVASAALTYSAVLALALGLLVVLRRPGRADTTVAALVGLGAAGVGQLTATNGQTDLLWSAAFAAAALLLLVAGEPHHVAPGMVCAAAAALTKNEGVVAVVLLLALFVIRRGIRFAAPRAAAATLTLLWPMTVRVMGAPSDIAESPGWEQLARWDPAVTSRAGPIIATLWHWMAPALVVVGVVTVLGSIGLRRTRRALGAGSTLWLWIAAAGVAAAMALTYVVSGADIKYHLRSSADRTTIAPRLLLLTECAVWLLVALNELPWLRRHGRSPVREAEPVPHT